MELKGCKHWGILFDKGYAGAQQDKRAIIPNKTSFMQSLTTLEKKKNGEISVDEMIVEN